MNDNELMEKIRFERLTEEDWQNLKSKDLQSARDILRDIHIDGYCEGYEDGKEEQR